MYKLLVTFAALLVFAVSAFAQPRIFTLKDRDVIVATSEGNEIRFNRDFKGQTFQDVLGCRRVLCWNSM